MFSLFLNQKSNTKNINQIKETLSYYKAIKTHLLKTSLFSISKFLIIELNLKLSLKIIQYENTFVTSKKSLHLFVNQKSQNCSSFNNLSLEKIKKSFFVRSFFKQIFLLESFIKGRVYQFFKNGFIVILNGLVCFLPINNCSYINFNVGKLNIFLISILKRNNFKKTIILSQRNIHKKIHYTLLKMASRLIFLKNFMADVTQLVRVLNCEFKRMSSILIICPFM
jgi:hypothetical protein